MYDYILAFLMGGALCIPAQLLIDKTRLTPARILVIYVVSGVLLGGIGVYGTLTDIFGAGARVPLPGFGNAIAEGVKRAVDEDGLFGVLKGTFSSMSAGLTAAVLLSTLSAILFRSKRR